MNIPPRNTATSPQNIAISSNSLYDSPSQNTSNSVSGSSSLFCTSPLVPINFPDNQNTYTNWSLKYNTHNLPPASPPSPYPSRKHAKNNQTSLASSAADDDDIFEFNMNDSVAPEAGKSSLSDSLHGDGVKNATASHFDESGSKRKSHEKDRRKIAEFFSNHTCFDLMPTSGKVVAISTKLSLRVAIKALLENDIKGVSVVDQKTFEFCGMFTVSDCVHVFSYFFENTPEASITEFFEQTIESLRGLVPAGHSSPIFGQPDNTLLEACKMLIDNRIHRVPIIDPETNNLLQIVNTDQLLRFLIFNIPTKRRSFLQKTIGELGIGSFGSNTPRVSPHTSFREVLELLFPYQTPGVMILNPDGTLYELYSKNDLLNLASFNKLSEIPNKPISEIIEMGMFDRVKEKCICKMSDTFQSTVEQILSTKKRRSIIVDGENKVIGLVTMWDILHFLIE
eukprot:TRINITY_DN4807_c0_g1_i1.p1 TRINITY_DN4807_c0_g1~~TRINITY_DN4807_c0_g1_i1.p1  ORF type:complete len:460 (+),score=132.83 TRINITY_DN4807_c0_g1_i1:26-1381(+)